MKISDGQWLTKKGYAVHAAAMAWTLAPDGPSALVADAPEYPYEERGRTLGGSLLSVRFEAVAPDTIRVRAVRHAGARGPGGAAFELEALPPFVGRVEETAEGFELFAGRTSVFVRRGAPWRFELRRDGRTLARSPDGGTAWIEEDAAHAKARAALHDWDDFFDRPPDPPGTGSLRQRFRLAPGECVYGLGERFGALAKNGQSIEMWNCDGGTSSDQSYKNVPFFVTSHGWGVFVCDPGPVSFEVASEQVEEVSFSLPGETLDFFFYAGDTPAEAVARHTAVTGRPALPPARSFGLWLSTSFTTDYDEKTVAAFTDGMRARGIPLSMFHFDCFWMKAAHWTDFEWDEKQFPDPEGLLARLHAKGLGVCAWINPYIAQRSRLFDEAARAGYLLRRTDGSVFQTDWWQSGMAIVDFTNPAARAWFAGYVTRLLEQGVDAVKTDFGERIPAEGVAWHDGSDPLRMHNFYAHLYNKVVFEAVEAHEGRGKAVLFARAATAGGQKFPVHWGGDCYATYEAMAETLRGGLSLGASGFGFFSHDIGGFEQTASPDVYKRWCAFGLLSTHSRLHGSGSYRVPWAYEEDDPADPQNACAVLRFFANLKGRLLPYLYAQAVRTHETGVPMMRATVLDFPRDPATPPLDRQYLLGSDLLVAPIFNEEGTADVYLPAAGGPWTDILTGDTAEGGRFVRRTCDYLHVPVYARPGSILVWGAFRGEAEYDYLEGAEAVIYGLSDGAAATARVVDCEGRDLATIAAERRGDRVLVRTTPTDRRFSVRLASQDPAAAAAIGGDRTEAELSLPASVSQN